MVNRLKFFVYPYKQGSKSAKALATALGGKVLKLEGSRFRPRDRNKVINWGSSNCQLQSLNTSAAVREASNKLATFQKLAVEGGPRLPQWTTDKNEALGWLRKSTVLARTSLQGHSGSGIIVVNKGETGLPDAPLYVKYIYKDEEYRVHIFKGEVIDTQKKVRDPDKEPTTWKIRSHKNGFIFIRNGVELSEEVREQSLRAFRLSGCDFAAVDVIVREGKAYVLELNTAVGLEGTTVEKYRDAIKRFYNVT